MVERGKIKILQNLTVDKGLLKYKPEETDKSESTGNVLLSPESFGNIDSGFRAGGDSQLEYLEYVHENAPTLGIKFKLWLYKKLYGKRFQHDTRKFKKIDIPKFFESLKGSVSDLDTEEVNRLLAKYNTVLENAQYNNQTALVEKITDYAEIMRYEIILSQSEFRKFLTEEDIVNFYNQYSVHEKFNTGLCLTYIKNFVKIIPEEITKLRKKAESLRVFDNYVILHYDPSGKAVQDTKEEEEKKKDPIMFGVIKGSKKLYYIGDWVDEYCDLTLDVIIDKLGIEEKVLTEDNILDI